MDARLVSPVAAPAIFRMDTEKLPSYTGVDLPGMGYALFKLTRLSDGDKLDEGRKQALTRQLDSLRSQEDVQVYLAALRARYKVEINPAALEAKDK